MISLGTPVPTTRYDSSGTNRHLSTCELFLSSNTRLEQGYICLSRLNFIRSIVAQDRKVIGFSIMTTLKDWQPDKPPCRRIAPRCPTTREPRGEEEAGPADLTCGRVIHICSTLAQYSFQKHASVHVSPYQTPSDVCSLGQVHGVDCQPKYSDMSGCRAAQVTCRYILTTNAASERVVEASKPENELPGRPSCQTGRHSCARQSTDKADSVQQTQQRHLFST